MPASIGGGGGGGDAHEPLVTGVHMPAGVVSLQVRHMVESHAVLQQTCSSVQTPLAHSLVAEHVLPSAFLVWQLPLLSQ